MFNLLIAAPEDLGVYTCTATNSQGKAQEVIQLTGKHKVAHIIRKVPHISRKVYETRRDSPVNNRLSTNYYFSNIYLHFY